jgi:hypothetical protein
LKTGNTQKKKKKKKKKEEEEEEELAGTVLRPINRSNKSDY